MPMLEREVGRIVCNGHPTGEISQTLCCQKLPTALLPDSLQDKNCLNIWRLRDGN